MKNMSKALVGTAVAGAMAMSSATPAFAQSRHYDRDRGGVSVGDVIAGAGNSGGNDQSGLYFEMRHRGRAFDPLGWVTIR